MRRILLVLVLAVVGAGWYGLAGSATAVSVNGASLTNSDLHAELTAFAQNSGLQCYFAAMTSNTMPASGAGGHTVGASGAAAWANLVVEGLGVDQYATSHLHFRATAAQRATALNSLEGEMTQAATKAGYNCPVSAAAAIAAMPASMRARQVEDQASSTYLVSTLDKTIQLTPANILKYYQSHVSDFDKLCISVALVPPAEASSFAASQAAGLSVAALAKKYSVDASATKGGAYGCYGPTTSSYSLIRSDIGTATTGHFPTSPVQSDYNGTTYDLYVAVTSRSTTPFTQAQSAVVAAIQSANASNASVVTAGLLYQAAVVIDPTYGRWGLSSSGPSVFAPSVPADSGSATTSQLTTAATTSYQ